MNAPVKTFIFLFACLAGYCLAAGAALDSQKEVGLAVEPGWLLIRDVPAGQLYDVDAMSKTKFTIRNGSDQARRYGVKADKPAKVGVNVLKGYTGIPDPAWFWFETNFVTVPANGAQSIKMFARIPGEDKYCNQKWAVGIDVEGKPEGGGGLVLAVSPVFYIETEARADLKEKPAGLLGMAPGTVVLENAAAGKSKSVAEIKVYNNDSRKHTYKVSSVIPSAAPGCQVIGVTPGFEWISKAEWLMPACRELKIGPNEMKTLVLDLDIPQNAGLTGHSCEGIIMLEPEEGSADFVRVQLKTIGR